MAVLEATGGGITGSSTLKVIGPYDRRGQVAPNLNLVVPRGQLSVMAFFLEIQGYSWRAPRQARDMLNTVEICLHYRHEVTGRLIIVTESRRDTILSVVLDGKNTSTMNIITARNLYSFYPSFTASGRAYCGLTTHTEADSRQAARLWGIDLRDPITQPFIDDSACRMECPKLSRKVLGGKGVGRFCWDQHGVEHKDLGCERFSWSLGNRCLNPGCNDKDPALYNGWLGSI